MSLGTPRAPAVRRPRAAAAGGGVAPPAPHHDVLSRPFRAFCIDHWVVLLAEVDQGSRDGGRGGQGPAVLRGSRHTPRRTRHTPRRIWRAVTGVRGDSIYSEGIGKTARSPPIGTSPPVAPAGFQQDVGQRRSGRGALHSRPPDHYPGATSSVFWVRPLMKTDQRVQKGDG